MMRSIISIILISFCSLCIAQTDTIFNQTDPKGKKQGYWKVKYQNGNIKYTAFYKDDKPVGLMKRYYSDNSLMAEMYFYPNSTKISAKLYYQSGPLTAEGVYSDRDIKDSTWNYYSYYTKNLSSRESYVKGKKNGIAYSYFSNGKTAEEKGWKNDVMDGIWRQFYENGVIRFSTSFVNGKRTGLFFSNYPDGHMEWKGSYKDDKRDGKWTHFDITGKEINSIEYSNGVALNAAKLMEEEQKELDSIESKKGKIPEPDESMVR